MGRRWYSIVGFGLVIALFQGTIGPACTVGNSTVGAPSAGAHSVALVADATRLWRTLEGHPDAISLQAAAALRSAMSPAELGYIANLRWDSVTSPQVFLRDPILRKALLTMAIRFPMAGGMSERRTSLTFGTANAQPTPCSTVNSGMGAAIRGLSGVLAGGALGTACVVSSVTGVGALACAGAAMYMVWHSGVATLLVDGIVGTAFDRFDAVLGNCAREPDQHADPVLARSEAESRPDPEPGSHPANPVSGCPAGQAHLGCRGACAPYGTGCDVCTEGCSVGMTCLAGFCIASPMCAGRCDGTDGLGQRCPALACPAGQTCGGAGACVAMTDAGTCGRQGEPCCASSVCNEPGTSCDATLRLCALDRDAGVDTGTDAGTDAPSSECTGFWVASFRAQPAEFCPGVYQHRERNQTFQIGISPGPSSILYVPGVGGCFTGDPATCRLSCDRSFYSLGCPRARAMDTLDLRSGVAAYQILCEDTCEILTIQGTIVRN